MAFYLKQAKEYGDPVLELACGTGRIAIPLAQAGHKVLGLDLSDSMLAEARRKTADLHVSVEWIQADIRQFKLNRKFALIIFPFATVGALLETTDLEACLACVKRHLKKGGRFVLDALNPRVGILNRNPQERFPCREYSDPDGSGTIVITESNIYDSATQVSTVRWYFKFPGRSDEVMDELNIRMYYPQELDAILRYNGFRVEAKYGSFDETPFTSASERQIIICRADGE